MEGIFSHRFSANEYAGQDDLVRWTTIKNRGSSCDECTMMIYEAGASQTREGPSIARTIRRVRDTTLYLCHAHAQLWKERDLAG